MKSVNMFPKEQEIVLCIKDFRKGLNLTDCQNVADMDYAVSCYNFDFKSGALVEGIGFKDATVPIDNVYGSQEILPQKPLVMEYKNVWLYRHYSKAVDDRHDLLVYRLGNTYCYFMKLFTLDTTLYYLDDVEYNKTPFYCNYIYGQTNTDACFFSSEEGSFIWTGIVEPKSLPNCPCLVDMCEHKDKIFMIECGPKNYIRYTTDKAILNWTKELQECEGKIFFNDDRGLACKIMSCFGHLFCIREYGITKITTYENSTQFNVSHIYSSGSRIFENTVCNCGDKIYMLTKSGLYSFNGSSCEKIDTKLNNLLEKIASENTMAAYRSGIYYIASKIDFEDGKQIGCENDPNHKNNVLIAFNIIDKTYTITRGIDISFISTIQQGSLDKTFFCYNTNYNTKLGEIAYNGGFFGDTVSKYWCSPLSDLGYSNKTKYVKEISLLSKYDCTLTVFTESESKTFNILGKNLLTKLPVRIKGKQVGIKIETNSQQAYVSNMKIKINLQENRFN